MDNNLQFGSGSALLGGTDVLGEAMARRQTGQAGVTAQQTPASAGGAPALPQPSGTPTSPTPGATASGVPPASGLDSAGESQMIVKALDARLRSLSKLAGG